jgi:hypothetical protein
LKERRWFRFRKARSQRIMHRNLERPSQWCRMQLWHHRWWVCLQRYLSWNRSVKLIILIPGSIMPWSSSIRNRSSKMNLKSLRRAHLTKPKKSKLRKASQRLRKKTLIGSMKLKH